ncbi:MAG: AAA family ATPase [Planctomycetota bacterium]|nr:MAG: AAA family ATPase [Planctomycetota bacterium]
MTGVFDGLLGQERAIAALAASIAGGRVHHAWVFHGPAGVGKFTAAMRFARALLTPGLTSAQSISPESLAPESHPDLHVVTKELARHSDDASVRSRKLTSIPKEVLVERLLRPAALAPTVRAQSLAKKVFIVDEAELMAPVAQNALLKTLEEPPAGSVIVLVTASEELLLPTIRSRCQRVAFGPLDEGAMRAWLAGAGLDLDEAESEWLLAACPGSPGEVAVAARSGLAQTLASLEPMLVAAEAGRFEPALGPALADAVDAWASAEVERRKADNPSKDAANKAAARRLAAALLERARRRLRQPAGSADVDRALRDVEIITRAEAHVRANVNLRLAFENLAAQLAR